MPASSGTSTPRLKAESGLKIRQVSQFANTFPRFFASCVSWKGKRPPFVPCILQSGRVCAQSCNGKVAGGRRVCVQFRKAGQATRQRQEEAPTMPHLTPADRPQRENSLRRNFHFRVSWRLSGASSSMPSSFAAFPVFLVILVILHIFHGGNRPHYRRFPPLVFALPCSYAYSCPCGTWLL